MSLAFPDLKLAALAHARYPDVHPVLAVSFLESDRRAAGMGALKPRSRAWGKVRNTKAADLLTGRVIYTREINVPARNEFPSIDFDACVSFDYIGQESTVTVTMVPARNIARAVQVEGRDLYENRALVARYLRQLRRETREA